MASSSCNPFTAHLVDRTAGGVERFKLSASVAEQLGEPSRSGEFADKLGSLPTHVVSSTLDDPLCSKLNRNLEAVAAALRDAMDDLETFEWRGVDPLCGR